MQELTRDKQNTTNLPENILDIPPPRPHNQRPLFILLAVIILAAVGVGMMLLAARKPIAKPPVAPSPPGAVQPQAAVQPTGGGVAQRAETGIRFQEYNRTFREFGRQYDDVTLLMFRVGYADVGGDLAYLAIIEDREMFIVHRGREIGRELTGQGGIIGPWDVGGTPAFGVLARGDPTALTGVGSYIDVAGQKFGQQYADLKDLASVNGKLAFIGVNADPTRPGYDRSVVFYDGREYGQQFDEVSEPFSMNGKLAFFASGGRASPDYWSVVVVTDWAETILPESRYEDGEVKDGDGKTIYLQRAGSFAKDEAIVNGKRVSVGVESSPQNLFGRGYLYAGDQRSGEEYEDVFEVELVNGKLALLVQKNSKGVIIYDGQEYGHHYDYLYTQPGYSTDPYSLARPNTFTAINYLGDVGGKLTYVVTIESRKDPRDFKNIIVMEE